MKKVSRLVVTLLVVLSLGILVAGCSCSSSSSSSSNSSSNASANSSSSSTSGSKEIVGSWKYDGGGDYTYVFNADGTGSYAGRDFTYTDDGKELAITYPGNTAPMKTTYTISGDTLTIKDSLDKDVVYKKVK